MFECLSKQTTHSDLENSNIIDTCNSIMHEHRPTQERHHDYAPREQNNMYYSNIQV